MHLIFRLRLSQSTPNSSACEVAAWWTIGGDGGGGGGIKLIVLY